MSHKFIQKGASFTDHTFVKIEAGRGGDGCVSFLREKYLPKGPPNGGCGGHGGDVYIVATDNEKSLSTPQRVVAKQGMNGRGSSMNGRKGDDTILTVPIGTVLRELDVPQGMLTYTDKERGPWIHYPRYEEENMHSDRLKDAERILRYQQRSMQPKQQRSERILLDLDRATPLHQPFLLCRGGTGGFGNTFFATSNNRAPRMASRGLEGEERYFELELKTIANIGLVGLPNAGKSTFIRSISNAKPRVANYAFTTLTPFLGTITYDLEKQFTVADIPGIIEGASQNKGLGHGFLRHIERARILAYVIDLSHKPVDDYEILRKELRAYLPGLEDRQSIIIANKADMVRNNASLLELRAVVDMHWKLSRIKGSTSCPLVIPLSAKDIHGVDYAVRIMADLVEADALESGKSEVAEKTINVVEG